MGLVIIDCHCHAGKGDKMTAPWNTDAPVEAYLRRARAAGIDKTIVLAPLHGNYQIANRQVARIVARYPSRLIGFAFVHTKRDAGRIFQMVKQAVTRWGFRGIKVHGFEGMPTREVCETAKAFQLPILVDIVSRPEMVDMFASEYPDVNFIIAHLGSFTDDWKAHQQVAYQLARYPNVYADTSGVRQFRYLVEAIKRGGPRKLLFGSDGPWLHPGVELHKIRLLGLAPDEEKMVLGGNILRLLRRARVGQSALRVANSKKYQPNSGALHLRKFKVREQSLEEFQSHREPLAGESLYRP
ncbi:MAG TPA: amidohydrolase family protein [Candidatus Angelobacter sp.]|nr:amidohydrolase family protein [Candidatus Angelobacter sp.]